MKQRRRNGKECATILVRIIGILLGNAEKGHVKASGTLIYTFRIDC